MSFYKFSSKSKKDLKNTKNALSKKNAQKEGKIFILIFKQLQKNIKKTLKKMIKKDTTY